MPKIVTPLTGMQIKNAKARDKPYKLADGGGMYLEVTPTGGKLWRMKFRQAIGKENRLAFGKYPVVTLGEAREKHAAARKLLEQGLDPGAEKKDKECVKKDAAANTFEKLAREWHTN